MLIKKSFIMLCIAFSLFFLLGNSETSAGGCYMPRKTMHGTAKAKQAVYIRSMPCMEQGGTVATAKSQEVMTISQESDGRYELTRADGTVGRVYHTWLIEINAQETDAVSYTTNTETPQQTFTLSLSIRQQLDDFAYKVNTLYADKKPLIIEKLYFIKSQHPERKEIIDYILFVL